VRLPSFQRALPPQRSWRQRLRRGNGSLLMTPVGYSQRRPPLRCSSSPWRQPNRGPAAAGLPRLTYVISFFLASFPLILTSFPLSQTSNGNIPCDDKEGHYIIVPDDIIYNRCTFTSFTAIISFIRSTRVYLTDRTVRLLGQGTFGKVVEAVDIHNQHRVAIKIIRAIPKYRDASKIEIRVLQKLKERDPSNIQCVLEMHLLPVDSF
jgi:hypothetical protein